MTRPGDIPAGRRLWKRLLIAGAGGALLALLSGAAHAALPKAPCKAPGGASPPSLAARHRDLREKWRRLMDDISAQRAKCSQVRSDQKALGAACRAARDEISQRWGRYDRGLAAYEKAREDSLSLRRKEVRERIARVEKRLAHTRKKLTHFMKNPARHQKDLRAWAELGSKAHEEAFEEARDAIVSVALKHLGAKKGAGIRLTQRHRRSVKELLKHYGPILKYANKFSAERLASLESDAEMVEALGKIHDALSASKTNFFSPKDRREVLAGISRLLGVFVNDPALSLLLTDAGIVTAASYGWTKGIIARKRVEQLLALSGEELSEVSALSRLFRKDIRRRKALRREQASLSKAAGGC